MEKANGEKEEKLLKLLEINNEMIGLNENLLKMKENLENDVLSA